MHIGARAFEQLLAAARAVGAPELAVPRVMLTIEAIPLLGSGKTDYVRLQSMAENASSHAPNTSDVASV